MMTLLDSIKEIPQIERNIIRDRKETFAPLFEKLKQRAIHSVVLCGSGTSNNASIAAARFIEKVSLLPVTTILPNEFLAKAVYDPTALYVFISQTGTSTLVLEGVRKMREKDFLTVGISETPETPLAEEAEVFISMNCGVEKFMQRTIGYTATLCAELIMGLELGLYYGNLTAKEYDSYLEDMAKAPASQERMPEQVHGWFEKSKNMFWDVSNILYYNR